MTRIIAGRAGGRRLAVPARGTRPTSDRVREALFSTVQSLLLAEGRGWSELTVLDAYAGSGALGLEALSRGATRVVLVERSGPAVEVIRRNIATVGIDGAVVVPTTLHSLAQRPADDAFDLVLVDPPYEIASSAVAAELGELAEHGWLAPDAIVVVERPESDDACPMPWPSFQQRDYGDTRLWYGRFTGIGEE